LVSACLSYEEDEGEHFFEVLQAEAMSNAR